MVSTVLLLLYDFLSVKNNVNVPSKSKKQKTYKKTMPKVLVPIGVRYMMSSKQLLIISHLSNWLGRHF